MLRCAEQAPVELELWQAEWCPHSHRVRQRLTELGLPYVARQVPAVRQQRDELRRLTGRTTVPVLVHRGRIVADEREILGYLEQHFAEPQGAAEHREKAQEKELEWVAAHAAV